MSGNSIIKFFKDTYKATSLVDALKAGGLKALSDGSVGHQTLVMGPGAKLVGTDANGNKYYERMTEQYGRHRWVIYANLDWYTGQDAASIAPEWHGWLHHITDANPATAPSAYAPPLYAIPKKGLTPAGVPRYAPKGAWTNPAQRNWVKVQAWKPHGAAGA